MVFVFGYPAGESEEPIFSGRVAGTVSDTLQFPIREIRDNEIRQTIPSSALFLRQPSNIKDTIIYDPLTKRYVVASLIGGKYYYNRPFMETLQDLLKARSKMSLYEYNRRQIQEGNKYDFKSLVSDIQFLDKILSPIFGINKIRIEVQGSAELTLGVKTNKVDNPTLPIDMRKTTSLDFDEKIQFNIGGNIGDLVNLDWSYNTEATFDYDNILKLNYEGKEDDIVKKVEAGNVSLPLTGTLISGGQNLWGFRTDLQFGKLSMSSIFSQQKGESKVIQLEKGAEKQDFEVSALRYEANKHFFLSRFFREKGIAAEIHEIAGSVEIAPSVGMADAIFDIVSSGGTLVTNGLKEVEQVLFSEAVLIGGRALSDDKRQILSQLLFRIEAVERSRGLKYVLMNLPHAKIPEAVRILPGMKSPTILPLAQEGWSSMHVVINERELWSKIEQLKAIGAEDILVLSLEKMIR